MKKYFLLIGAMLPFAAQAQHTNVLIGQQFNPNEPSICINPENPAQLVAGANLNNYYFSSDTGKTWTSGGLTSPYGVWGDPVISVDTNGHFLFLHLSNPANGNWIDRIVCQKSVDGGQLWSQGTFTGLNGGKAQDKHWIAIDRNTNTYYVTWTEFDEYGTSNPLDSSRIHFSKSTDAGQTWTPAKRINKTSGDCFDSDLTTEGAVPCVGPNGEVYVAWAGPAGLVFDRSLDGGDTWLANDIKIDNFPGGWDYNIPGLSRCNGLPVTVCDLSNGPYHGTIYVNWTDQRNGANDTDVWLSKSTDGGNTWSAPARVNDDPPGRHQFMTWMTVDQATGWLWFVFYDRRSYADNRTDVYMALSKDGGASFQNFKVSENYFTPNTNQFFGDYTNVTAYNNVVRPIWTRMDGVSTSVFTALIDVSVLAPSATKGQEALLDLSPAFPNPADSETWIPFKIHDKTSASLRILDSNGKVVHTVFEHKEFNYGKYTERIPVEELHLPAGSYWVTLTARDKVLAQKMVVLH
ncbi:MAG: T9SS type A sorting domain-containing protein [Saprospiraceae bacterium]